MFTASVESQNVTAERHVLTPEKLAACLATFPLPARQRLTAAFSSPAFAGRLETDVVGSVGMKIQELMMGLLPLAQLYALAEYRVGAIAEGASGALYFGANLEVPRMPLGWTLHAEQSAVVGAFVYGEKSLRRLAVTAAPCGHCRQFLNELETPSKLEIIVARHKPMTLAQLLPNSFGPADLGVSASLLARADLRVQTSAGATNELARAALDALRRSYAPYSRSPSSLAFETWNGAVVAAPYIENAAYNPSVSPVLGALDRLRFHNATAADIRNAVLVELEEARIEQASISREIIKAAGSAVELKILKVSLAAD